MTIERSRYNYFVDRDEGVMVFNARTGSFALMTSELANLLRGSEGSVSDLEQASELCRLGFLHTGDELTEIAGRFELQRTSGCSVHLALLPTLECNLQCSYCFQRGAHRRSTMSPDVQRAVVGYARSLAQQGRTFFQVSWYGGEPLMAADVVLSLTRELTTTLDEFGAEHEFTMVSNGELLTIDLARQLSAAGIQAIQVSVDCLHEQAGRRGVLREDGRLSRIVENAATANQVLEVTVRVNVDASNQHELKSIISHLKCAGLTSISFAKVHDFALECLGRARSGGRPANLLSSPVFARVERADLLSHPDALALMLRRLQPKGHFCAATSGAMRVIAPDGSVTRCWETAGVDGHAFANVLDTDAADGHADDPWLRYDPLLRRACRACPVLPLCMGSCPNPMVVLGARHTICDSIRFTVNELVDAVGRHIEINESELAAVQQ